MENPMRKPNMSKSNESKPNRSKPSKPSKPRTGRNTTSPPEAEPDAMRASAAYALVDPAGEDPVPDDIDVFRLALARRMATFLGMPRRCREPLCRRRKCCVGEDMRCMRDDPRPELSPEQAARAKAEMRRALERRMAEIGADEAGR
jgi:hypothetical protein